MTRIPVNPGPFHFEKSDFRPDRGGGRLIGSPPDPRSDALAAGIVVGLPSGERPESAIDPLVEFVRRERDDGRAETEVCVYLQVGVYRHRESGEIVTENAVRLFVFRRAEETRDAFEGNVLDLAEVLCLKFGRREAIVEFQARGLTTRVCGVIP